MDWKGCGRFLLMHLIFLSIGLTAFAQNLVPNPSFEDNTGCPYNNGQVWKAEPWYSVYGGCDYYNECGTMGFGIPSNRFGGGYAWDGQAYVQISLWYAGVANGREMVGIQLTDELVLGVTYNVELHLSLMDSFTVATRNVGVHFSPTQHVAYMDSILALTPQVRYEGQEYLADKEGWMRISGSFVAQGGERYIAIGNFDDDANTDTVSVPGGGAFNPDLPDYWESSGYFIDDVSVIPDSVTSVYEHVQRQAFKMYPNPATGTITIECQLEQGDMAELMVFDMMGRRVYRDKRVCGSNSIQLSGLGVGLYQSVLVLNGKVSLTEKLVISIE